MQTELKEYSNQPFDGAARFEVKCKYKNYIALCNFLRDNRKQDDEIVYRIKDEAGNTTKLTFSKLKQEGKEIKAELRSVQYNSALPIEFTKTELKYEWSVDKRTGEIKELEQKIGVKDTFEIQAKYNREKNETEVRIKKGGEEETTQTLSGLVIIKLTTKSGILGFEY